MSAIKRGFTLIELLLVVAVIGLICSLLIPNIITAVQKTKQKGTMRDIMVIATACANYVTDHGNWMAISQDGPLQSRNEFIMGICPFYVKAVTPNDQWGQPFYVYVGPEAVSNGISGIPVEDIGDDDFLIISYGRDAELGPTYTQYNPDEPSAGIYQVLSILDFNEDMVNWNGSWIIGPRLAKFTQ